MESATETPRHEAPRVRRAARSAGRTAERDRARVGSIITRLVHDAYRPRAGPAAQAHASNPIGVYTALVSDLRPDRDFLRGSVTPWPNAGCFSGRSARGGRLRLPVDRSGVDGLARSRDHLEVQIVAVDLVEHEALILIEARLRHCRPMEVTGAKLSRRARDEVVDPLLRLQALVDVIVP